MSPLAAYLPPALALTAGAGFLRRGEDGAGAALKAAVATVWAAWGLSEGLGAAGQLTAPALALGWGLLLAGAAAWAFRGAARPASAAPAGPPSGEARVALALAAGLGLAGFASALLLPHYNIDGSLYHLPRIEQWIQQRGLRHFPASYDLQDFYPPGAEILMLQLRLLAGSDRLAGLVQWAAWLLACLAVWDICAGLGGGRRARALALLAWLATPMAVLQMPTVQNDLVAAAALLTAVDLLLRRRRGAGGRPGPWCAAALGAALLVKGTLYLFALPFAGWLLLLTLRDDRGAAGAARAALLAGLMLLPSLPHWSRNAALSGSPLGTAGEHGNAAPGPGPLLSHALKALGDELRWPWDPWNQSVLAVVARTHALLGLPLNDPADDWKGLPYGRYTINAAHWDEDYSGAPMQMLLLLALAAAWLRRRPGIPAAPLRYAAAALAALLLHLALLRYNPWETRLHLPLLGLLAPLLGLGLARLAGRRTAWTAALLLALQAPLPALQDFRRPWALVGRDSLEKLWLEVAGVREGMDAARNAHAIGLLVPERCREYGVWRGAHTADPAVRIQHLEASPSTRALLARPPWSAFTPDAILADAAAHPGPRLRWGGRRWDLAGRGPNFNLFRPAPSDAPHAGGG